MSAVKVARKPIHQSMGSKKNDKVPRVLNVPKIGGFLPIVPILKAFSALGSLASNNARMTKEDMEEKKRHNKFIESVSVGEGF